MICAYFCISLVCGKVLPQHAESLLRFPFVSQFNYILRLFFSQSQSKLRASSAKVAASGARWCADHSHQRSAKCLVEEVKLCVSLLSVVILCIHFFWCWRK